MSYSGPDPRGKRSSSAQSARRGLPLPPPPARRAPSVTDDHWDDHRPTVVFAAGIAIGLAVGAGIALMFAPETGDDLRHDIGHATKRMATRSAKRVSRNSHDAWDDLRDEFQRAIRRRRRAFQKRREDALDVLDG